MERTKSSSLDEIKKELWSAAELLTQVSTLHGAAWYSLAKKPWLKGVIVLVLSMYFWAVLGLVFITVRNAVLDESISRTVIEDYEEILDIPQFTICHPYYFDKESMKRLGIPDANLTSFSTYLALPFDLVKLVQDFSPRTIEEIQEFEDYRDSIMKEFQFETVVDLLQNISIRCDQFVNGVSYFGHILNNSCTNLFDPLPIWTAQGICYRSNHKNFTSLNPGIVSGLTLYVTLYPDVYADLDYEVFGASLLTKRSPSFTFHKDFMSFGVMSRLQSFQAKKLTSVGLKFNKVNRFDTESHYMVAKEKRCKDQYPEFDQAYPALKKYSKSLCRELTYDYTSSNCTVLPFSRLPNVRKLSICSALDIARGSPVSKSASEIKLERCPDDCYEETYEIVETSIAEVNTAFLEGSQYAVEIESSAILEIHFHTHMVVETKFTKSGVVEILSQAGGFLGVTIGASAVTFLEMFFTIVFAMKLSWKWLVIKRIWRKDESHKRKFHKSALPF